MDALERVRKIIDTVLVNSADIDWLDDEMLAGRLGLKEASNILLEATAAFSNRAGRRAATKKAPARRKAPAKTTPAKKTTRKATS
jgi:topoisomerase IA-like protein